MKIVANRFRASCSSCTPTVNIGSLAHSRVTAGTATAAEAEETGTDPNPLAAVAPEPGKCCEEGRWLELGAEPFCGAVSGLAWVDNGSGLARAVVG